MASSPHFRRRARLSSSLVLAATVAVGLAVSGGEAIASDVSCGDTITADTTLDSDLIDCPNNGIVIGADDVTLDLNGHLIDGDGAPAAGCDPETDWCDIGVLNVGYNGVTVRDGSMRGFDFGAVVGEARHNRLLRISSSRNLSFGFFIFAVTQSLVRDSSASHNIPPKGDGMGLFGSHHLRIVDNSFRDNPGPGVHVGDSNHNLIKGNRISHNSPGILMQADRNRVRRNRFAGNDAGIIVGPGSHNVIARNRLSEDGDGIAIEEGRGNLVERNVVVGAREDGIYLGLGAPPIGGVDTVIRRNEVRGSGDDGFDVRRKDNHSVLKRNIAVRSGDDGFDIESRSTKLRRNQARRNGDLGIAVRRGAIDGGGNRASGNGDSRQCVNVRCQ